MCRSSCTSSQAESRHEPERFVQRELGRLHAGLHADQVLDVARQLAG